MNTQITPAQRQQVAQIWRQSAEAQHMGPQQVDQFAQQIVGGGADPQVLQFLTQSQTQQTQNPGNATGFRFQTPFGTMQIPLLPMMQMPMMPSMQFLGMPQVPLATAMPLMTPMAPASLPGMPLMPSMSASPAMMMPRATQQTIRFPGGSGTQQNVNFSGRSGNATFSYSSSSTSSDWSNNHAQAASQHALPAPQGYQSPYAIEAMPQTGFAQSVAPTPLPQYQVTPQPAFQAFSPQPGHLQPVPPTAMQQPQAVHQLTYPMFPPPSGSIPPPTLCAEAPGQRAPSLSEAAPAMEPHKGTNTTSQNQRLHDRFTRQLNDDTYFSKPPGAPGQSAPQGQE